MLLKTLLYTSFVDAIARATMMYDSIIVSRPKKIKVDPLI
jgi:hypothetical protein